MDIRMQSVTMPKTDAELNELVKHLNSEWGSKGWSVSGVTTVASSTMLLFVFQKPVAPAGLAMAAIGGGVTGGTGSPPDADDPGDAPARVRSRRGQT